MNPILQLRQRLKISQAELGAELGVTQSAVSQFEKGSAVPSPETVQRLIDCAKKRGVDVSFDSIYAPLARNGVIDRMAASDDSQNPVGTKGDEKLARMVA
jgi:putative transcriptional regulator